MRAVIQRVKRASVTVDSKVLSRIEKGLVVLIGICPDDTDEDCLKMSKKITSLKLWPNSEQKQWKSNISDIDGQIICVSQFTLYGKVNKGAKPDFHGAAKGDQALGLYNKVRELIALHMKNGMSDVGDGKFGAMMDVELVNDGPVTIQYDTKST